jgi:peptide deformylase
LEADGLLAIALQHELDHLDGVLLVDHVSKMKRSIIMRRMKKARRLQAAE